MKNKIFDIFYGFGLALPVAVMAGALSLPAIAGSGSMLAAAAGCTLLLSWPVLAKLCMDGRRAPNHGEFQRQLLVCQFALPLVATAVMFSMLHLPKGDAGGAAWMAMCIVGATIIFTGWLGALLASTAN